MSREGLKPRGAPLRWRCLEDGMDKHDCRRGLGEAQEISRRQPLAAAGSGLITAATPPQQSLAGTLESPPLPSNEHFMRMAIARKPSRRTSPLAQ
jgi:hypothetical protein